MKKMKILMIDIIREEYNTQEDDYIYQNKNQMDINSMGYKGYDKYNKEKEYFEDISEIKIKWI